MRSAAGFSLVEVLCAILILGVGLIGLTQGVTAALRSNKECELQSAAALLAAAQLETLRAEGFLANGVTEGAGGEGLSLYQWKQTVTDAGLNGLHEVLVEISQARTGQLIYELRTLLFEAPLDSTPEGDSKKAAPPKRSGGRRR
jgi:type IV pilus modification protein PilV